MKRGKYVFKKVWVFLCFLTVSLIFSSVTFCAEKEKIGVLFITVGETEDYDAGWSIQFFNNLYDVFDPGFFAGGPIEGGRCYTGIHYANEAEAFMCGVPEGTPIDQFCQPYTGSYPIHSLDYWDPPPWGDDDFRLNCFYYPDPYNPPSVYYPLYFGAFWTNDPESSGMGIADFVEVTNFSRMNRYYRFPDYKNYNMKELLKWWYGNEAPGYSPDLPELINIKDTLEALYPEYEFIYRHGTEGYMENKDVYGNPAYNPESTETAIEELVAAGVKKIIVADCYASFSNMTQFGHEWYDKNGQGISALPAKTFKECVEDLADGKGPATQADLDDYLTHKPWSDHENHPFPFIKKVVENLDPSIEIKFAEPYGKYPEFEEAVVDLLRYTVEKYAIPHTASLKVVLISHGYYNGYKNAQECDSYFRMVDDLSSRVIARVKNSFNWAGKFEVVAGPAEFAEDMYDPPSAEKPFGNILSAGELVDQSINGLYVNGWGILVDNGTNNYDYIIAIPFFFEAVSSDTVYGKREEILGNNKATPGFSYFSRDDRDKDGTEYDTGDIDDEYFTVKTFDGTGWLSKPKGSTIKYPKGSATNPTTIIITGSILDLQSTSGYGFSARTGLTVAEVRAISETLEEPTLISLASFEALPGNHSVTLRWVTESEMDNVGFNIYRSEKIDGGYIKINDTLIPASGNALKGSLYEFQDKGLRNGVSYFYLLEDVDTKGKTERHGPVFATPRFISAPLLDSRK